RGSTPHRHPRCARVRIAQGQARHPDRCRNQPRNQGPTPMATPTASATAARRRAAAAAATRSRAALAQRGRDRAKVAELTAFTWVGIDKRGVKIKGEAVSKNANLVKADLRNQGINPQSVKPKPKPL